MLRLIGFVSVKKMGKKVFKSIFGSEGVPEDHEIFAIGESTKIFHEDELII